MNEAARLELDHRVRLYQFYIDCYIKGAATFLAIMAALLKFAVDAGTYRSVFSVAALVCCAAILIPLSFGVFDERRMSRDFIRLAAATGTVAISTAPLRMLSAAVAVFWLIVACGWFYILVWMK
jgi:hypothetical protein